MSDHAPNADTFNVVQQTRYFQISAASLMLLIALLICWEWFLAPLRPGGSWVILKVIPLLFPLPKILRRDNYTMQWSSMLIFIYFTEGVVRATSDISVISRGLACAEIILSLIFFFSTIFYIRPHKIIAKQRKKASEQTGT